MQIRELSDLELLELAVAENDDREGVHPLEDASAYATMLELGADIASIALKMDMTEKTVRQRLALANLTVEARDAFQAGEMNLALAQALTSASKETQRYVVNEVKQGFDWTSTEVARFIGNQHMKVEDAIFPLEAYKGEISQNLFQEEADALFLDSEQAKRLQHKAMQAKAEELRKEHAWVDTLRSSELMTAEYFSEGKGEPGAVLVFYEESGKVETHAPAYKRDEPERRDKSEKGKSKTGKEETEAKPKPPKASFTKKLLVEARVSKTQALQNELVGQFRTCLILCIMGLLGVDEVKLKPDQEDTAHKDAHSERAKGVFERHQEALSAFSSYSSLNNEEYPLRVGRWGTEAAEVYAYLAAQSDEALHELFTALVAVSVGSWVGYDVDLGDSALAVKLADDLQLDMHKHFILDAEHLKLYRKAQLADIAKGVGVPFEVSGMKTPSIHSVIMDRKGAVDYLPPVMTFFPKGETPPGPTLVETLVNPISEADEDLPQAA